MNDNDIEMDHMKFNDINYIQLRIRNQIYRVLRGKNCFLEILIVEVDKYAKTITNISY